VPATMEEPNLPPVARSGAPYERYLQSARHPNDANDRLHVWAFHVDWTHPLQARTSIRSQIFPVTPFPRLRVLR